MTRRQNRWVEIHTGMLDDRTAQQLSGGEFKAAFLQAARGHGGALAEFVRPHHGRPCQAEWSRLRAEVFERDGYACLYCGATGRLECDHVVPVSRGGTNDLANLATACRPCNRSKRAKTPEEWRA